MGTGDIRHAECEGLQTCGPEAHCLLILVPSEGRGWAQATSDTPDVRVCRPADLKQKLMARRMEAPDKFGNPINVGDLVDVKQGSYLEGKSGTVKYIWRGKLFLQSK